MASVLRAAPWRRAPLLFRRQPAASLAVGATALILGLSAAASPLYLASVGSAAVSLQQAQRCQWALGNVATGSGPLSGIDPAEASLASLSARTLEGSGAPAAALVAPKLTMEAGVAASRTGGAQNAQVAQLVTRTGGLSHIQVVSSAGGSGVWLSDDYSSLLRARAGDSVQMSFDDPNAPPMTGLVTTPVRVAGIYRQLVGTTLPPYWCSMSAVFGRPDSNFPPPPVVLANESTFRSLLRSMHVSTVRFMVWEQPPALGLSLPDAQRTALATLHFFATLGGGAHRIAGGFEVTDAVDPQYAFIAAHAAAIRQAVGQGILPTALAGVAIAALLMAAAGSYWVDRRSFELALLASRGVGPAALGLKASLEMLVPIVTGAALGWSAAVGLVALAGPSPAFGSAAVTDALWLALGGASLGLILLGLVGAMRARSRTERPVGSKRHPWAKVPVEVIGLLLALWIWHTLSNVSFDAGGTSAQPVQTGFLVFPLVFLVSGAVLFARLLVAALRRRPVHAATEESPVSVWLAVRRLTGAPHAAGIVIASVAVALGVFVYAAALTRSEESTLHAKAETYVGADVAATTDSLVTLPGSLAPRATDVLVDRYEMIGSTPVDVIGVNPVTFDQAAFWDASFARPSLATLMTDLAVAARSRGRVPVIVAGDPLLSLKGGVTFTSSSSAFSSFGVRKIESTAAFPGENGSTPLLVMTLQDLNRLDPDATPQVWAHGSQSEVLSLLGAAGVAVPTVVSSDSVLDLTSFASIGWTFDGLQSLGILIGVVAVGGLLLFVTSRSRSRALSYGLARRMGLSQRSHAMALALELGSLFATGALLGAGIAWLAVEMVAAHLNPLPDLPPVALVEVPWIALGGGALVAVWTWMLTTAWTQHVADRSRASELLRFDD